MRMITTAVLLYLSKILTILSFLHSHLDPFDLLYSRLLSIRKNLLGNWRLILLTSMEASLHLEEAELYYLM